MNQHHACKEDNDSAGDNEKNSETILLFLGESTGCLLYTSSLLEIAIRDPKENVPMMVIVYMG